MMSGANGSSPQLNMQNGSPTRVSPVSHQQSMPSAMNQNFPFPNQTPGTSIDPRLFSTLTPQQQANLSAMNPQQRQLFLLQQQQNLMRGGQHSNPGMGNPGGMMNPQMLAAAQERLQQQARMSQVNSPTHPPSIGGNAMDPNMIPSLRSNPGMPGIARSTRTPSDHGPSPMTPQSAQRSQNQSAEEYQRAMIQHAQRGMTPHTQSPAMPQMAGGVPNSNWQQAHANQPSMGHGQGPYGMSPSNSTGNIGGMSNASSPAGNQAWSQNAGGMSQHTFNTGSPAPGLGQDGSSSRQTSMTPAPHQMNQGSPVTDQNGMGDFDLFNWNQ